MKAMAQELWSQPYTQAQVDFWAPGFALTQPWLYQELGDEPADTQSLSLSSKLKIKIDHAMTISKGNLPFCVEQKPNTAAIKLSSANS